MERREFLKLAVIAGMRDIHKEDSHDLFLPKTETDINQKETVKLGKLTTVDFASMSDGELNPNHWNINEGTVVPGWNKALHANKKENVLIKDGCLVIMAKKEEWADPNNPKNKRGYTSGRIDTENKGAEDGGIIPHLEYGEIEVEAELPMKTGSWPSIWFHANSDGYTDQELGYSHQKV
jgi:beta-glucanase (GH16 family)